MEFTPAKKTLHLHTVSHMKYSQIFWKKQYDPHKSSWVNDLVSIEKIFQVLSAFFKAQFQPIVKRSALDHKRECTLT